MSLQSGMLRMQYTHVMAMTMMATAFAWNFPATAFQGLPVVGLAGAGEGDPQLGAHNTECLLQVSKSFDVLSLLILVVHPIAICLIMYLVPPGLMCAFVVHFRVTCDTLNGRTRIYL